MRLARPGVVELTAKGSSYTMNDPFRNFEREGPLIIPYGKRSGSPDGKRNLRLAPSSPVHNLQADQRRQDSKLPSRRRMAVRKDVILRWMAEKSMQSRQVRKVIEAGVNGGSRSR
jgi:hypothetical protein